MGPNTISGHLSVIYTVECQINFALRIAKPVLRALANSRSVLPSLQTSPDTVVVSDAAEKRDNEELQQKAKRLVWATGCTSWFLDSKTGRNTQMYPDWQYKYWVRSFWFPWKDFQYSESSFPILGKQQNLSSPWTTGAKCGAFAICIVGGVAYVKSVL